MHTTREQLIQLANALRHRRIRIDELKKGSAAERWISALNDVLFEFPDRAGSGAIEFITLALNDYERHFSPSGFFVDSNHVLGILDVRADYLGTKGDTTAKARLGMSLFRGSRPHTEMVKALPLHLKSHPGYIAPLEDLLDHLAVVFYAGRRAGDAEDGAVGWLLRFAIEELGQEGEDKERVFLRKLAEEMEHWTAERLTECLEVWDQVVGPAVRDL